MLSLDSMGKICGVTGQAVHQWETGGTANIKLQPFLKFCAHFGVDPYDLVFADDKDRPSPRGGTARLRRLPP